MKHILLISGSASRESANEKIILWLGEQLRDEFEITFLVDLKILPHFDPEQSSGQPPEPVLKFRAQIEKASGVVICTPEYVFSIPSGLKNALEWCVATTVFSNKPVGLITASASGVQGHEELQRIMRTIMAKFRDNTTLLIPGVRGRFDADGQLKDSDTIHQLIGFKNAFVDLCNQ